jgi:hypothetical protein
MGAGEVYSLGSGCCTYKAVLQYNPETPDMLD